MDERLARRALPGLHHAVVERQGFVADRQAFLEAHLSAEAAAVRAGALGVVMRKRARADRFVRLAAVFAGKVKREHVLFPAAVFLGEHARAVTAFAEGELERVRETAALIGPGDDAVDHDVELLRVAAAEQAGGFVERGDRAVHADAGEAAAAEVGGRFEENGGLIFGDGRHDHQAVAGGDGFEGAKVVVERATADGVAVLQAAAVAGDDPEGAGVVRDLGQGGDGRPGVGVATGALGDGDDRGEAPDEVHIRPGGGVQHPAGLGGEGFEVLAAALGVQGVEGQGRLTRAADPRDDGQLVTRDGQFHVLEVVGAGSLDVDGRVQDSGR